MTQSSTFVYEPQVSTIEEFLAKFVDGNPYLKPDARQALIEQVQRSPSQWHTYQRGKPDTSNVFTLVQNWQPLCSFFYKCGYGPETLVKHANWKVNVELIRTRQNQLFRPRNPEEQVLYRKVSGSNKGDFRVRYDLIPAHDEIIRLYKIGRGTPWIGREFNCSEDTIVKILNEYGEYNELNKNLVRTTKLATLIATSLTRTQEEKQQSNDQRQKTRLLRNTKERAKQKYIKTIREKYGDENIVNVSQVQCVFEKQQRHRYYEYMFKCGTKINVQGYERFALDYLQNVGYGYRDLDFRKFFWYVDSVGIRRKYFADIHIKSTSQVIEVKSKWTIKKVSDKNRSILKHMLESNIPFQFWVYDPMGNRIIIDSLVDFDEYISTK